MKYSIIATEVQSEQGEIFKTYGLTSESISVEDISINLCEVEAIVKQFNLLEVEACHVYDILDFLIS